MSLELVRLVADYLADATTGVNALLANVPRDGGDAPPAAIAAVYDRTRHGWLARGRVPENEASIQYPCLLVTPADAAWRPPPHVIAGGARVLDGTASVAVQLVQRTTMTEAGVTDDSYTLRAVRGCLLAFAAAVQSTRTRNGVTYPLLTDLRAQHVDAGDGAAAVTGLVVATFTTRETTPLAAVPTA